tara:strand:+ start:321 stop:494 length:174 start_codon:yes stop_codon:yes gene_type:complete
MELFDVEEKMEPETELAFVSGVYTIFTSPMSSSSRNEAVLSGAFIFSFLVSFSPLQG